MKRNHRFSYLLT